jgi:hypothetical protein
MENKIIAEVGVQRGDFSSQILSCNPKELYLIDCWAEQSIISYKDSANVKQTRQDQLYEHVVNRFRNKSNVKIIRKFSNEGCQDFEDGFFDFVYIDANHSFEAVYNDLTMWWGKIKVGGYLTGHDLVGKFPGVKQAVENFCNERSLNYIELNRISFGIQKT